jgi:hypothetical protein
MNSNFTLDTNQFVNLNVKLLTTGSYGVIFKITSSEPLFFKRDNKYLTDRPNYNLLLKFSAINDNGTYDDNLTFIFGNKSHLDLDISPVTSKHFINENEIQNEIYRNSYAYHQPLCPKIISYFLLDLKNINKEINKEQKQLLQIISYMMNRNTELKNFLSERNLKYCTHLGLSFMEYLDGYEPLYKIKLEYNKPGINKQIDYHRPEFIQYELRAIVALIELALLGFNHSDFHFGNIMYKRIFENDPEYYESLSMGGRIMLIDFGKTYKLDPSIHSQIIDLYKKKEYLKIMFMLYEKNENSYHDIYSSVFDYIIKFKSNSKYNLTNPKIIEIMLNRILDTIIQSRELSKQLYYRKNQGYTRKELNRLKKLNINYKTQIQQLEQELYSSNDSGESNSNNEILLKPQIPRFNAQKTKHNRKNRNSKTYKNN